VLNIKSVTPNVITTVGITKNIITDVDFFNLFSGFWANASTGFLVFCTGLFLISISLATIFTAKEIDKETDRNYVASMFSNVVALVALVVSLVALVKG
jgi:hypothetical protein